MSTVEADLETSPGAPPQHAPRPTLATVAAIVVAGLLAVVVFGALAWRLTGGHWLIESTPSMGRASPVGTLVLTRPVDVADVKVGDIVSYHPPSGAKETITHRVVSVDGHGGLRTKGDINGSVDPWVVHQHDLVGRVVARWWAVGWLVKGLPILVVGGLVLWAATRYYASDRWRGPIRLFGASMLVALVAILMKPFVRMGVLGMSTDRSGAHAVVVSTGLLPVRITARDGGHADLINGAVGHVSTRHFDGAGHYLFSSSLHLSFWWWVAVVACCAAPLLWSLTVGVGPVPLESDQATA